MKRLRPMYLITITILSSLSFEIRCSKVHVEISYGELVDKITILTIKSQRITNAEKLQNIRTELASLQETFDEYIGDRTDIAKLQTELQEINQFLWDIQDNIRIQDHSQNFNDEFVQLARNVYFTNDKRTAIKRKINTLLDSHITEKKSYEIKHGKVPAEISYGELIEKIIILNLKLYVINNPEELTKTTTHLAFLQKLVDKHIGNHSNIAALQTELEELQQTFNECIGDRVDIAGLQEELRKIDQLILHLEVGIRIQEYNKSFDDKFVQLARNIHLTNDRRAEIKREINILLDSNVVEEKSYQTYA